MIGIVDIFGGFGNQLFQISFALHLKQKGIKTYTYISDSLLNNENKEYQENRNLIISSSDFGITMLSKKHLYILDKYKIESEVIVSNVDEDQIKESLIAEKATPLLISKNLAELKSTTVSRKIPDLLVLGADSVISLNNELINKPNSRNEALDILKRLNNSKHYLISSVCISKNGSMIWNYSDQSELKMKNLKEQELVDYLKKIKTEILLNYGVYQIEAEGASLFEYIEGDPESIMGLPIKHILNYIKQHKK